MENKTVDLLVKGEKFTVKIKSTITGNLKSKLISIIKRKPVNEVQVKFNEALKSVTDPEGATTQQLSIQMLQSGKLTSEDIVKFNSGDYVPDNAMEYDEYLFDFMKEIIEPTIEFNDIKDDRDFWNDQDIEMIEETVNSFRERLKF